MEIFLSSAGGNGGQSKYNSREGTGAKRPKGQGIGSKGTITQDSASHTHRDCAQATKATASSNGGISSYLFCLDCASF